MAALDFCAHLECGVVVGFIREHGNYRDFQTVEGRLPPRVRFFAFYAILRAEDITYAYRFMCVDEGWRKFGFESKPTYELLREFINERIGTDMLHALFDTIIREVAGQCERSGHSVGRRVGEDATDKQSLKHDREAEYSGYYKHSGYKVDVAHDMDDPSLVLEYTPMSINGDEGKCLIPSRRKIASAGMSTAEWKIDGKYATYVNIAYCGTGKIHMVYRIQDSWVYNEAGEWESIESLYQRYHSEDDFVAGASMEWMLSYLERKGEHEAVGSFFRNMAMAMDEEDHEQSKKEYGERSGKTEGQFAVAKHETLLDARLPKRGFAAFVRLCGITYLAGALAALIRVQHNVFTHLGCLTYIT